MHYVFVYMNYEISICSIDNQCIEGCSSMLIGTGQAQNASVEQPTVIKIERSTCKHKRKNNNTQNFNVETKLTTIESWMSVNMDS
jgi:hypothetical protein